MNILYLIGNGFDINLGLQTGYQSFYDYYLKQKTDSKNIARLKQHLTAERFKTWSDLEWGLGQYTENVTSIEELEELYFDLGDQLRLYLNKERASLDVSSAMKSAIDRGLCYPHVFLQDGVKREISSFLGSGGKTIDVITFNYTETLERVFNFTRSSSAFPTQINRNDILRNIRHVHMSLEDSDFIMGVNDDSQIKNKELVNDACRRLLVKPYINRQLQSLVDEECLDLISNADLICLFGVSLGMTDKMWWEAVGMRMLRSTAHLIYFLYDNPPVTRNSQVIGKIQDARSKLIDRFGVDKASEGLIRRIHVGYNTSVFKPE